MKQVYSQYHGKHVKLGRRRPAALGPHLKLARYMKATLPTAPPSADYTEKAMASLNSMFGNDDLGDCVIAGGYHTTGVETGNAGLCYVPSDDLIIKDYSAIAGYVPGDPSTDRGTNEVDALNYWTSHGFANGTKLLGWLTVDATDKEEVKSALWLFENLMFGIELPDAWVNPMPSVPGFVWDVAGNPDPEQGHCIVGAGYDDTGVIVSTWGMLGKVTYDATAAYAKASAGGELYVMLSPDQLAKGATKCPNGVAWSDLIADFDKIGGTVPIPVTPPVNPTPGAAPTLEQVKQWVSAGISSGPSLLWRGHAIGLANTAITQNWPKT